MGFNNFSTIVLAWNNCLSFFMRVAWVLPNVQKWSCLEFFIFSTIFLAWTSETVLHPSCTLAWVSTYVQKKFLPGILRFFNNYSCMDFRNCFTSFLHSCLGFNLCSKNVLAWISTFFQKLFLHGCQQLFNILFALLHGFQPMFKKCSCMDFYVFSTLFCLDINFFQQ